MVGLLTLTWAWAETTLVMTIGVVNENAGPIEGHSEAPLSLKRRLRCFRAALRTIAVLKPFQEEGSALAERFGQLGVRRHDFVHGAAWQTHEGAFESLAIGVRAGNYATKNHSFNVEDARLLIVEVAKLQDDMADFMLTLVGETHALFMVLQAVVRTHPNAGALLSELNVAEQVGLASLEPHPVQDAVIHGYQHVIGGIRQALAANRENNLRAG